MLNSALDSRRLFIFRAVAEAGSISLAARHIHLSQPAVSTQVQQLEEAVGKPLFERLPRGVALTDAGVQLLEYARRVEALLDEAFEAVSPESPSVAPLILAASTTIASYLAPELIAAFIDARGHVPVRLEVGNTAQVLEWVERGAVPLGLVEGRPDSGRIRLEPFVADPIIAVVAPDASPEFQNIQSPDDLHALPIIWREAGSGTRSVVEYALKAASNRRPTEQDLEFGSTEAIKQAVRLKLGVGFVSRRAVEGELSRGQFKTLDIDALKITRDYSWAIPGRDLGGITARFYHFAGKYQQNQAPSALS